MGVALLAFLTLVIFCLIIWLVAFIVIKKITKNTTDFEIVIEDNDSIELDEPEDYDLIQQLHYHIGDEVYSDKT